MTDADCCEAEVGADEKQKAWKINGAAYSEGQPFRRNGRCSRCGQAQFLRPAWSRKGCKREDKMNLLTISENDTRTSWDSYSSVAMKILLDDSYMPRRATQFG